MRVYISGDLKLNEKRVFDGIAQAINHLQKAG